METTDGNRLLRNETIFVLNPGDNRRDFMVIYNAHHQHIYAIAMRYLKIPAHAEQVVAEVFSALWSAWQKQPVCDIEQWLHTCSRTIIINRLKQMALAPQPGKNLETVSRQTGSSVQDQESNLQQSCSLALRHT